MYKRDIRTITRHTPRGPQRVRVAMGAYSDLSQGNCGSDQKYDPKFVFPGLPPGQCVNQEQYSTYHANDTATSSSSGGSFWDNLASGLASALKPGQSPQAPVIVQGGGGISTTTALAIGGGALLLVVLLTRK